MPAALANARETPPRTAASRTHGPAPALRSVRGRRFRHARKRPSPRGRCRTGATDPASSRYRCSPCSGSSAHWPVTRTPHPSACRCRSPLPCRGRRFRRALRARWLRHAADIRPARSQCCRAGNAWPDKPRRRTVARNCTLAAHSDIVAVMVGFLIAVLVGAVVAMDNCSSGLRSVPPLRDWGLSFGLPRTPHAAPSWAKFIAAPAGLDYCRFPRSFRTLLFCKTRPALTLPGS